MTTAGVDQLHLARLIQELSGRVSEDLAAAKLRANDEKRPKHYREDQRTLVQALSERRDNINNLADHVAALDPRTVAGAPPALDQIKSLATYLLHQISQLEVEPAVARAFHAKHPTRPRLTLVPYRVAAYLRVSTDRQVDEGFGLDVQEQAVREWARTQKARVAYVVTDEGRSGAAELDDRPGLAEVLGHLQGKRVDGIVVARIDRIARDLVLQEWIRAEILRAGGELRSASPVEDLYLRDDPTDPTGNLVRQILGAVSEYERAMVRLRMEAGKAVKRKAGGYAGGQPPFGYRSQDRELVRDEDEQQTLNRIRRWRREGKTYRDIADRLNYERIPSRHNAIWYPITVSRILKRAS